MKRIFVRIESTQSSVSVDLRTGEVSRGNQSALRGAFDVEAYRRSGLAYIRPRQSAWCRPVTQ